MENCVFCKIINGEIPSKPIFEDADMIIIEDINPQAVNHYLLIPKLHYGSIVEMDEREGKILGRCLFKFGQLAGSLGLADGFRLINNCGENACQTVSHLHFHIIGGEKLSEKIV